MSAPRKTSYGDSTDAYRRNIDNSFLQRLNLNNTYSIFLKIPTLMWHIQNILWVRSSGDIIRVFWRFLGHLGECRPHEKKNVSHLYSKFVVKTRLTLRSERPFSKFCVKILMKNVTNSSEIIPQKILLITTLCA